MDTKEFKSLFGCIAQKYGFEFAFGAWFKESSECIFVLELQKSNYGNYYELNIKTFIQNVFGNHYIKNKDLAKKYMGNIFNRQPGEYHDVFDLEHTMSDSERKAMLESLFANFIDGFSKKALTLTGIRELEKSKQISLFPAVKIELEQLGAVMGD